MFKYRPVHKSTHETSPPRPIVYASRVRRSNQIGRSGALEHGLLEWQPSAPFITESLTVLQQAGRNLQLIPSHDVGSANSALLQQLLHETVIIMRNGMPPELPYFSPDSRRHSPHRPRIAGVIREWLLTSRCPRRLEHLETFLQAYQDLTPLCLAEIRLIPTALRLAVGEKIRRLPSSAVPGHMELLPRVISALAETCRLIADTNWHQFGEEVSRVHSVLIHDPARLYHQLDFDGRHACRQSVEKLSRLAGTTETSTAQHALLMAQRHQARLSHFLLGSGREALLQTLLNDASENPATPRWEENSSSTRHLP